MSINQDQIELMRASAKEAKENRPIVIKELLELIPEKHHSFFKNVPATYRLMALNIYLGKCKSYTKVNKFKCLECSGWSRDEVKECTVRTCPLFMSRPFQNKEIENEELEIIDNEEK